MTAIPAILSLLSTGFGLHWIFRPAQILSHWAPDSKHDESTLKTTEEVLAKQIEKGHLDVLINQCESYRDSALLFEEEDKTEKEKFLLELDNLSIALGQLQKFEFSEKVAS